MTQTTKVRELAENLATITIDVKGPLFVVGGSKLDSHECQIADAFEKAISAFLEGLMIPQLHERGIL